jgi:hypothetical protein
MDKTIEMTIILNKTTKKSEWNEQNHKKQVGGKNHRTNMSTINH